MSDTSVLLVRLYGIRVEYHPGDGYSPGVAKGPDDNPIVITYKNALCWGVVQLFSK